MRHAKDFLRRGAASLLAAAVLCAVSLAAEPEKSQAERGREDLEFLYQTVLVENHPNAFANAPESEFLALKKDIESRLETESDVEFLLDLQRLTSLVGDSHTTSQKASSRAPHRFRIRSGKALSARRRTWPRRRLMIPVTMASPHPLHGLDLSADPQLARRHGQKCQPLSLYTQDAPGGVGVNLLVRVGEDAGVVLQIQLAAAHHLQPGQSGHHVRRQVEQLRHRGEDAALPVFSNSLHLQFTPCVTLCGIRRKLD